MQDMPSTLVLLAECSEYGVWQEGWGLMKKKLMAAFGTLPLEMALSSLQVSVGKRKMAHFLKKEVM